MLRPIIALGLLFTCRTRLGPAAHRWRQVQGQVRERSRARARILRQARRSHAPASSPSFRSFCSRFVQAEAGTAGWQRIDTRVQGWRRDVVGCADAHRRERRRNAHPGYHDRNEVAPPRPPTAVKAGAVRSASDAVEAPPPARERPEPATCRKISYCREAVKRYAPRQFQHGHFPLLYARVCFAANMKTAMTLLR